MFNKFNTIVLAPSHHSAIKTSCTSSSSKPKSRCRKQNSERRNKRRQKDDDYDDDERDRIHESGTSNNSSTDKNAPNQKRKRQIMEYNNRWMYDKTKDGNTTNFTNTPRITRKIKSSTKASSRRRLQQQPQKGDGPTNSFGLVKEKKRKKSPPPRRAHDDNNDDDEQEDASKDDGWRVYIPHEHSSTFPTSFVKVLEMIDNIWDTRRHYFPSLMHLSSCYSFVDELYDHPRHGPRKGIQTRHRLRKRQKNRDNDDNGDGDRRLMWHHHNERWSPSTRLDLCSFVEVLIEVARDGFNNY